ARSVKCSTGTRRPYSRRRCVAGAGGRRAGRAHRVHAEPDFAAVRAILANVAVGQVLEDPLLQRGPAVCLALARVDAGPVAVETSVEEDALPAWRQLPRDLLHAGRGLRQV